jgi:hypothetical protein
MNVNNHHDKPGACSCEFCVPSFVALDPEPVLPTPAPTLPLTNRVVTQAVVEAKANTPHPQPMLRRIGPFVVEDLRVFATN